jgi:hypothetical protein
MRSPTRTWCATFAAILLLSAGTAWPQKPAPAAKPAAAVTPSQVQANEILMRMAEFLKNAQRFSVTVRDNYDAVQSSGQKIEFGGTRKLTLSRPDRLRVEGERSDGAKILTVFTGKEIVLIDTASNVYATETQTAGLDETIVHFVRDLGMKLPLAMLLVSQLPTELQNRVRSIDYVEKTKIDGATSHHLAARGDTVDFQIWVAEGEKPLPQRVVITYKTVKGEPQFRADLSDWNLAPAITDATFVAKPPDGAQKVAFAADLPRLSVGRKAAADKGAK